MGNDSGCGQLGKGISSTAPILMAARDMCR
jgi:hypothetical protein